nr:RsbRD N-terminal domain-containing protein [candidate division Zixibacteria bacterium]
MNLIEVLNEHRRDIENGWIRSILETYPPDSVKFFARQKDRFQNPVGQAISNGVAILLDELLADFNTAQIESAVDDIVRIRSIQDFTPSQAVEFIFILKKIIRDTIGNSIITHNLVDELVDFENRIDRMALIIFDTYSKCREQVYEIRIRQARAGGMKLIERLNKKYGIPDPDSGL